MNPGARLRRALVPLVLTLTALAAPAAQAGEPARVVVLDTGAAMQGPPIQAAAAAARRLLGHAGGTPVGLVTAGAHASVVLPPTTHRDAIGDALAHVPATGGQPRLRDALLAAVHAAGPAGNVMVVSTGRDGGSRTTVAQVRRATREAHVRIDAMGTVPGWLSSLVAGSGGEALPVTSVAGLAGAARRLDGGAAGRTIVDGGSRRHGAVSATTGGGGVAIAPLAAALLLALLSAGLVVARRARRPRTAALLVDSWIEGAAGATGADPGRTAIDDPPIAEDGARWGALAAMLERADVSLTPGEWLLRRIVVAVVLAAAGLAIAGAPGAFVALVLVVLVARTKLKRRVAKRRAAFAGQLAETVQSIAGAMRAGHGLSGAVAMIAEDAAEPMATELRRVVGAERLGVPLDEALAEVVERTGNGDLEQLALVAVLQREVGGNGAEALDRIVDTVRHRDDVRRLVRTLTAQGQLSRWILTLLPIGLAGLLTVVGGDYMQPMFHTSTGLALLGVSGAMIVAGSLWIGRVVEIEV